MSGRDDDLWRAFCAGVKPLRDRPRPPMRLPFRAAVSSSPQITGGGDLHGMTLAEAHAFVERMLDGRGDRRSLTFVTGRSGAIRREFLHWLEGRGDVSRVEELRGGGAFRVHLRRRK